MLVNKLELNSFYKYVNAWAKYALDTKNREIFRKVIRDMSREDAFFLLSYLAGYFRIYRKDLEYLIADSEKEIKKGEC